VQFFFWLQTGTGPAFPRLYFRTSGATIRLVAGRNSSMSERDGNSFLWFLAGLGVGAIVGVLYAPLSGSETRRVIREKAEESSDFMRNRAREAREQARQWADRGRDVLREQKEQFRSAYEAGRQAYHETTNQESEGAKNL
jgi:gas vesicle protein